MVNHQPPFFGHARELNDRERSGPNQPLEPTDEHVI